MLVTGQTPNQRQQFEDEQAHEDFVAMQTAQLDAMKEQLTKYDEAQKRRMAEQNEDGDQAEDGQQKLHREEDRRRLIELKNEDLAKWIANYESDADLARNVHRKLMNGEEIVAQYEITSDGTSRVANPREVQLLRRNLAAGELYDFMLMNDKAAFDGREEMRRRLSSAAATAAAINNALQQAEYRFGGGEHSTSPAADWGPPMWACLHCLAETSPQKTPDFYKEFFTEHLGKTVPCKGCKQHLQDIKVKMDKLMLNVKNADGLLEATIKFHNWVSVDKRKQAVPAGKPPKPFTEEMDIDKAKALYKGKCPPLKTVVGNVDQPITDLMSLINSLNGMRW